MISSDRQGKRFKFRVAGLCVHNHRILLTKADGDGDWILPGGRVELGEDTRTTLKRELLEETGQETEVKDLLWIIEDFFRLDGADVHELSFVYAISPTEPTVLDNTWTHRTIDGDARIELRWFDLDHIETTDFQPSFLKSLLQAPPETPQHIIVKEPHQ